MLLGKPKYIDYYICVNSKQSLKLHSLGFEPMYREITQDKIYYLKNKELLKYINEGGLK